MAEQLASRAISLLKYTVRFSSQYFIRHIGVRASRSVLPLDTRRGGKRRQEEQAGR